MIFAGEDIPDKVYHQGEGCLLADGYPLYEVLEQERLEVYTSQMDIQMYIELRTIYIHSMDIIASRLFVLMNLGLPLN